MIIHNGFVLLLLRKLCVWQILQKGDPQFLPPPRYDTYDRYDYDLPEKGSVASNIPPQSPPLNSYISILANVHWVLLTKVRVVFHLCLMLRTYPSRSKKAYITLPTDVRIVGVSHKTFFRNTGELHAN